MSDPLTFKIIEPHNPNTVYHQWWFPNGWDGIGPTERRDAAGRLSGRRNLALPQWFVLACNNTDCPGRAVVPVSMLTEYADSQDEAVG